MNQRLYPATVVEVVDGDSVRLNVDLGFRASYKDLFRLAHINAPERGQEGAKEATARLRELLPVGSLVHVLSAKPEKYGRWLAEIFMENGLCANDIMVDEGFAVGYEGGAR